MRWGQTPPRLVTIIDVSWVFISPEKGLSGNIASEKEMSMISSSHQLQLSIQLPRTWLDFTAITNFQLSSLGWNAGARTDEMNRLHCIVLIEVKLGTGLMCTT